MITIVVAMIGTISLMAVITMMMIVMMVMLALIATLFRIPGDSGIDQTGLAPAASVVGREVNQSRNLAGRS